MPVDDQASPRAVDHDRPSKRRRNLRMAIAATVCGIAAVGATAFINHTVYRWSPGLRTF